MGETIGTASGSSGAGLTRLEPRTIAREIKKVELIGECMMVNPPGGFPPDVNNILYEVKIDEGEKLEATRNCSRIPASSQPLSYDNRTTTSPHNPLYVLHRWD